jgi:hypothetical protein
MFTSRKKEATLLILNLAQQMKLASNKLYDALFALANQGGSWRDVRHLQVLVWMVIGLIAEGSVNLTRHFDHIQSRAVYAQSSQRRFSRWLHNGRIGVYPCLSSLATAGFGRLARPSDVRSTGYHCAMESLLRGAVGVSVSRTSHTTSLAGLDTSQ